MTAQRTNTNKPRWPPGKAKLKALIEAAIADVYDESEQRTRFSPQASHSLKQRPRGRIPRAQLVAIPDLAGRRIRTENLHGAANHVRSAIPRRNGAVSKNVGGNCSADLRVTPKVTPTNVWLPLGAAGRRWTCKQQIHSISQSVARQSRRLKTSVDVGRLGPGRIRTYDQGIHLPRCFHRQWTISSPAHTVRVGAGRSCLLLRALRALR